MSAGRRDIAWLLIAGVLGAPSSIQAQHLPSAAELGDRLAPLPSQVQHLDRALAYASGWTGSGGQANRDVVGNLHILVILAQFADSPEPTYTREQVQAALFDGPNDQGTVSELYAAMSLGAFSVSGIVTPWIRSSLTLSQVKGGELNNGEPPQTGHFLLEAIAAADVNLDLGQFDNDGPDGVPNSGDDNGFIDSVFFLYGEVGEHCGGDGPWPHFGGISPRNDGQPYQSNDLRPDGSPIQVDAYVLSTAVNCAGTEVGAAPVAAHELGHVIGLPDFYHPTPVPDGHLAVNRRWVLGCFELMAAGAWGCGPADAFSGNFGPAGFSPWSKDRLGWIPIEHAVDVVQREYVLEPVQSSGHVLKVPLDDTGTESLLVEYRPQSGFDRVLPGSGVLIYHWDEDGSFRPDPAKDESYVVAMVEADNDGSLQRTHNEGGNRGELEDIWAADGAEVSFSGLTTPSPRRNDGTPAHVTFHSIRVEDGVARIRLSNRETATVVGGESLPDYAARDQVDVRLDVGGGVLPYTLEGTPDMPVGVTATLEGEELVLAGTPLNTGHFSGAIGIRDAVGRLGTSTLRLVVSSLNLAADRLLAPFLHTDHTPLTEVEIEILDNDGNRNGAYDVGDLRAQVIGR